jgi:preprotein translocase subunit SecA
LHVIGAQRHEARRIDDQLRGRSGRQGDPGSSQFYISLEDDLLRIFGGEKIKNLMEALKIPEDQPIEAKIISGAVEKAQRKVEGMNFDLRKYVLEYDDVIAKHRNKIYAIREEVLKKNYQELKKFVLSVLEKELNRIVSANLSQDGYHFDYQGIFEELRTIVPVDERVLEKMKEFSPEREEELMTFLMKLVKEYLKFKEEKEGEENMEKILRFITLRSIDVFWTEHLDMMEYLRDSVRLRAYGGRDPLVEYKTEGHKLFLKLQEMIDSQIARTVFKLTAQTGNA